MSVVEMSYAVAVPTLNAAKDWIAFEAGLKAQTLALKQVLILDSMSTDGTAELAAAAGYTVIPIPRAEFNHGGTRQLAIDRLTDVDVVIYLTQDAVLTDPDGLRALVEPFEDEAIGATYGRQMPRAAATASEAHARLFNYPAKSQVKSFEDRHALGIKATFMSNSCSAYRRTALLAVGGFPRNTIFAEDALSAAKMLMAGWKTAYVAEARVVHSHAYTVREEFSRYFDIGVYHHRERWMLEAFGSAGGEGRRFVVSELKYVGSRQPLQLPGVILRTGAKWLGYKLGNNEERLSPSWRRRLSMHKRFWDSDTLRSPKV